MTQGDGFKYVHYITAELSDGGGRHVTFFYSNNRIPNLSEAAEVVMRERPAYVGNVWITGLTTFINK